MVGLIYYRSHGLFELLSPTEHRGGQSSRVRMDMAPLRGLVNFLKQAVFFTLRIVIIATREHCFRIIEVSSERLSIVSGLLQGRVSARIFRAINVGCVEIDIEPVAKQPGVLIGNV